MSELIDGAVAALSDKISGGFDGSAKFVIEGEGAIMIDSTGVRAGDEPAEVTLIADKDTFRSILDGEMNPTSAYMSGKLTVEGDLAAAMRLGTALA
jgi:putative sterol carrier protein